MSAYTGDAARLIVTTALLLAAAVAASALVSAILGPEPPLGALL